MFENIFTFKINPWTNTGTIAELVEQSVLNGSVDLLTNLSEVDVLVGTNICFNTKPISFIPSNEVKGSVRKLREILISTKIVQEDEIYNFLSCLDFLSGSLGYLRSYEIVKNLSANDLDALVYALYSQKKQGMKDLNIAVKLDTNYKSSGIMNIQVKDILQKYYGYENNNENFFDHNAIIKIIPKWWWIQKIQNSK